ncbi:MAG: peptidylprolyl isomerase [Phycisphaerae bacterium]
MSDTTTVKFETNKGTITAELWPDRAPTTVANFVNYVKDGHFDGTIFHRVIEGFMIQGGGFTPEMQQKPTSDPIENEASADVPNERGTLAMARTSDPHSATAQFFINHKDNEFLNFSAPTMRGYGYCVFGKVSDGMDVVDEIAQTETTSKGPHDDVPAEPIVIEKAEVV